MFAFFLASCLCGKIRPSLIPEPKSVTFGDGVFTLKESTKITYDSSVAGALDVMHTIARDIRVSTGFPFDIVADQQITSDSIQFIKASSPMGKEDYELHVTKDSVSIVASTSNGFFFGFVTFLQLLPPEIYAKETVRDPLAVPWEAPVCDVVDSPRFSWRGIMLDVSRHFFDVDSVKRILDGMAMLKLNKFHWHLTDDQGWRIEIKKYPNFTLNGSKSKGRPVPWHNDRQDGVPYGPFYYTQEQIKDVVAYAAKYGITVVPEIEMPGHSLSGVAGYPEISCLGVGPFEPLPDFSGTLEVYCPGNDKTLEILQGVLDEVIELFPSEYIHVGGDECVKTRWQSCEKCQKRVKDEGLKSLEELQSWFIQKMANYMESKGRHLIGWDEILEGGLAQGAAVMSWRGTSGGAAAAAMGHEVVMSPNSYYYLDHHQFPEDDAYQYICCLKPLYRGYSYEPLDGIPEESHKYIMGVQGNQWTEYVWGGDCDVQHKIFPRAAAVAEVGWTTKENKNWDRFLNSEIRAMRKRFEMAHINAAPVQLGKRALWSPDTVTTSYQTYTWDITGAVKDAGEYRAMFIFTGGSNELNVKNVQLFFNDKQVAHDDHEGVASWVDTNNNVWTLTTSEKREGRKVYLKADIQGVQGTDTYGEAAVYYTGQY